MENLASRSLSKALRLLYIPAAILLTLILSTLLAALPTRFGFYEIEHLDPAKVVSTEFAIVFAVFFFIIIFIAFVGRAWAFANAMVNSAISELGDHNQHSDKLFDSKLSSIFGEELSANIRKYEVFCGNEYILDMQKHHFAWILLAISGVMTVAAAFLVIYLSLSIGDSEKYSALVGAMGAALPALVTGILLKIWLETRKNLARTRLRTDLIYKQRIRLLFVTGNLEEYPKEGLAARMSEGSQLLQYLRFGYEDDELAEDPE